MIEDRPSFLGQAAVRGYGLRNSRLLGIDVDAGDSEVERWFVAATLFGNRISADVVARTFRLLEQSGLHRIVQASDIDSDRLVALLDAGGYARYDLKMADRLHALAATVNGRYGGEVAAIGRRYADQTALAAALDELPGWGPVTVGVFLRELRGVWPGADLPLDPRAVEGARHLGILGQEGDELAAITAVAQDAGIDPRDLEAALIRLWTGHRRIEACPGGWQCTALAKPRPPSRGRIRRVRLPGRRTLTIRPIRPSDAPALMNLYTDLSEDDTYRRFFSGLPPPIRFVEHMTTVAQRGGAGLVAVIARRGSRPEVVAEASCEPLPDGDGELGITVAEHARGWLGPYLLDALLQESAALGMANLEADVLAINRPMLTMLRQRGVAVMGHEEAPAIVRLVISTTRRVPSWPGPHQRQRLLIEAAGGRWHAEDAAQSGGFEVLACPGPSAGWSGCPALRGEPCPLVTGADVVVDALSGETGQSLLEAHRRLHPSVPVCLDLSAPTAPSTPGDAPVLPAGASGAVVVGILQRLARRSGIEDDYS